MHMISASRAILMIYKIKSWNSSLKKVNKLTFDKTP